MGQKDSKPSNGYGYSSDYGGTSSGYNSRNTGSTSSSYGARYVPSSENNVQPETHARLQRKYSRIGDDYRSLSQVALMAWPHLLLVLLSALLLLVCVFH
jgi:E3 ubiquitin-protein ligase RGLG